MRYAIISDVHANAAALRAVLVDAQDLNAEKVICLGDVVGYGPDQLKNQADPEAAENRRVEIRLVTR